MQVCKSGGMEGNSRAFGNRLANEFIVDDTIFFFSNEQFFVNSFSN